MASIKNATYSGSRGPFVVDNALRTVTTVNIQLRREPAYREKRLKVEGSRFFYSGPYRCNRLTCTVLQ